MSKSKSYILIERMKVENANCVNGLIWGYPSIGAFLGFSHAIGRNLNIPSLLGGVSIFSHEFSLNTREDDYGAHYLCLKSQTPNRTKEAIGQSASLHEEGTMHLEVSILIECMEYADDIFDAQSEAKAGEILCHKIKSSIMKMNFSGGRINSFSDIKYIQNEEKTCKRMINSLMPCYCLIDRSEIIKQVEKSEKLKFWMDFFALKYKSSHNDEESESEWKLIRKIKSGFFKPVLLGYNPISEISNINESRKSDYDFCLTEGIYGIGQWISPHRINDISKLMWKYEFKNGKYLYSNK